MADQTKFIGLENVQTVATALAPNIVTGPAYFMRNELDRLGIAVETGIQNRKVYTVFAGKGGETRRKVVGDVQESKLGYFFERVLQTEICVHRIRVNEDYFKEKPAVIEIGGSAATTFPKTEFFMNEQGKLFAKDVFNCVINGEKTVEGKKLGMFDGLQTLISKDINDGVINVAAGNLVETGVFDAPITEGDTAAYDEYVKYDQQFSNELSDEEVYNLMPVAIANAIKDAYEQKHRSHDKAVTLPNGNYTLPDHPNRIFVPVKRMKGTRIISTVKGNIIVGIDNEGDQAFVNVMPEPSRDTKDMVFQIQSPFGVVVKDPSARAFCTNGGIVEVSFSSGDYMSDGVFATPNKDTLGSVAITNNGTPVENGTEVAKGTTLTLTATAKEGATFKQWSNGATTTTINIVTTGDPMYFTAVFEATASSSSE